ncbi:MAG: phosphodiester glycosidase family protein [Bacteroidota bacterium]
MMRLVFFFLLAGIAGAQPLDWRAVDSLNAQLPETIRVFAAVDTVRPVKAWMLRVDPGVRPRIEVSHDAEDLRSTTLDFASTHRACAALNAGYFAMGEVPSRHVGLLAMEDTVYAPATAELTRDDSLRFPTARSAFAVLDDGRYDIAWASSSGDSVFAWLAPPPHRPGRVAPVDAIEKRLWPVREAVSAGPMLVQDGEVRVTSDEEVFFGTSIPETHPRTAIGYTRSGELVAVVVDGRQSASRGVDLTELAEIMRDAGTLEALNLDGGGSSTLVTAGQLVNRPTGYAVQREVMSAIVIPCF